MMICSRRETKLRHRLRTKVRVRFTTAEKLNLDSNNFEFRNNLSGVTPASPKSEPRLIYIAIFFEIVQPAAASADSLTQGSGSGEGVITS